MKTVAKWSVSCTAPESAWLRLPCFIFTIAWSDQILLELSYLQIPLLTVFKIIYPALWGLDISIINTASDTFSYLSLYLCLSFRHAPFYKAVISDLYNQPSPCYIHEVEFHIFYCYVGRPTLQSSSLDALLLIGPLFEYSNINILLSWVNFDLFFISA